MRWHFLQDVIAIIIQDFRDALFYVEQLVTGYLHDDDIVVVDSNDNHLDDDDDDDDEDDDGDDDDDEPKTQILHIHLWNICVVNKWSP